MSITKLVRSITDRLPSNLGNSILARWLMVAAKARSSELRKLTIVDSGTRTEGDLELAFIKFENGTILHGRKATDLERRYGELVQAQGILPDSFNVEAFMVTIDAINRYVYPHAMPHLTPPYSLAERRCFHPQQRETVADLPGVSDEDKRTLVEHVAPKAGETYIDIGSYMGFGAIRLAQEIGDGGKVIAVEASEKNHRIMQLNLDANGITNVVAEHRAIWNKAGESMQLHLTQRQRNSLFADLVEGGATQTVETTSVDYLVEKHGLSEVNHVSLTVNGAELEALDGMTTLLDSPVFSKGRVSAAGWRIRDDKPIGDRIAAILREHGMRTVLGRLRGVLAWNGEPVVEQQQD